MTSRPAGRSVVSGRNGVSITELPRTDITALLAAWNDGDASAMGRLIPLVYDELHRIAENAMRGETQGHTLQATALIHETYLRLLGQRNSSWEDRSQFFGVAAHMMRRVLVDHARARLAEKRGGDARRITLDNIEQAPASEIDLLDLDDALERLQILDPIQSQVVEMRYFAGLSIDETADALSISPSTVKREWAIARAWLKRELS